MSCSCWCYVRFDKCSIAPCLPRARARSGQESSVVKCVVHGVPRTSAGTMMPGVNVRRRRATPTGSMRQHLSSLFVPQKHCGLINHLHRCVQGNSRLPRTPYVASNFHFTAVRLIFFLTLYQCFNQMMYLRFLMITALMLNLSSCS